MIFRMVYKSGQIFLPFCHNSRVWQTDRRTEGRTDRILIARSRPKTDFSAFQVSNNVARWNGCRKWGPARRRLL